MIETMKGTADRAPAMIGGGILGITLIGVGAAILSLPLTLLVEALAAAGGMLVARQLD